ncbi:DUF4350 domain-containing protein, partial [bacterium]|nr:DUF4350 domain-containing protein [bacterium]
MGRYSEGAVILVILAIFAAVSIWIISRSPASVEHFPQMSSYSPKKSGLKALFELLEQTGFDAQRFADTEYDYPEEGCVVVAQEQGIDLATLMFSVLDVKALRLWLERGGTLVLAADPDDTFATSLMSELGYDANAFVDDTLAANLWEELSSDPNALADDTAVAKLLEELSDDLNAPGQIAEELRAEWTQGGADGSAAAISRAYQPGQVYTLHDERPALWRNVEAIETA